MTPQSITDKGSRSYRSKLREEQAEQTRSRVVAAAAELFAAEGYARTTLAKVAAAAGVSVETVQGQGPKAALMIAAVEYTAFGVSGEQHVFNLEVGRRMLALTDRAEAADGLAAMQAEIFERIGELQIQRILEVYRDRGWLREDVPFEDLIETTAVIAGVETYLQLTHRSDWTMAAYREWVRRMLAENIFRP
jgi:AcrR family transcriptional regulator